MSHLHDKAMDVDVRMKQATQEAQETIDELDEEIANAQSDAEVAKLQKAKAELQAELDTQQYSK